MGKMPNAMILFLLCAFLPSALAEETISDIVDRHPHDPNRAFEHWNGEYALLVKEIESGEPMAGYTLLADLRARPETGQLVDALSDKLPDNSHIWGEMKDENIDLLAYRDRGRKGFQLYLTVCHAMLQAAREKDGEEFVRLGRVAVNLYCSAIWPLGLRRHLYLRILHTALRRRWLPKEVVREVVVFARESNQTFTKNVQIFDAPYFKEQKATGFLRVHAAELPNMLLFESLEVLTAPDADPCARLEENIRRAFASPYEEKRENPLDFEWECSMEDGQIRFSLRFKEPVFLYFADPWNPTFTFTGTDIKYIRADGKATSMLR